jgi:hypothetical protein
VLVGKNSVSAPVSLEVMRRLPPPDPYVEAKLLGILLSGVFGQTRKECAPESLLRLELRPSGVHRIQLVPSQPKPKR